MTPSPRLAMLRKQMGATEQLPAPNRREAPLLRVSEGFA